MNDPLTGRRAVWAYDWRRQAEHDAAAIIATCQQYGIWAFHQEVYYGLRWQGAIDGLSPASLDELTALRDALAAAGIALVPVVVPRGLIGEAEAHAAAMRACGAGIVDIEWDQSGDYWSARPELIAVYAKALRDACGADVMIGWQPDSRLADPARQAEWRLVVQPVLGFVDLFLPQLYAGWSTYGLGAEAVATDARRAEAFRATGKPVVPTLYLSESLAEPAALWNDHLAAWCPGVAAFRFGAMDRSALAAFAGFPVGGPKPGPKPEPAPGPTIEQVQLGLIEKIVHGEYRAARDDLTKIVGV